MLIRLSFYFLLILEFFHLILHLANFLNIYRFDNSKKSLVSYRIYFGSDLFSGLASTIILRKYYHKLLYLLIIPYIFFHVDANLYFWNKYSILSKKFWDKIMKISTNKYHDRSIIYIIGVLDEILLRSIFIYLYIKILFFHKII